ncbi:MAG: diguanylate cyclase (GGDEF)-like protein/PAS domain S-box-containing protein [Alphaproteobacteria bacterium]|jgi:diguanylate cyclase (GGDEF)-like protein/PAS domain S-box-containing protein
MNSLENSKPDENQVYTYQLPEDTSSKNVASELHTSEKRFSLAMRGTKDGLWDWDLETDEVYYSSHWKSMLGYSENELGNIITTWQSLLHPDDKHHVLEKINDYLSGRADSFEVEMRIHHKKGHFIVVLSRGYLVLRESDSKPVRLVGTHVDITDRKKLETFNNKNAEVLEMIAIGSPASKVYEAIALMYEDRHLGLRCSMLELHGNKLLHGGAPSLPKEYCEAVNGLIYGPSVGSCGSSTYTGKRVVVESIDTDHKWTKIKHLALPHGMRCCWSEPIKNSSGKVLGAFGMYYNHTAVPNEEESKDLSSAARLAGIVMERDQSHKIIRTLAYTDELTGLPNRAAFYRHLENVIKTSSRFNRRYGLLYIDLDNFKNINDSLGHSAGDLLLTVIATRLKSACRDIDFVARLSGDEFCVTVEEVDDYSSINVAQRCLEAISQALELLTRKITPACSIGIAYYPDDGEDLPSLIKAADTSLYVAKANGKNQYVCYTPEMTQKVEHDFQVEHFLREAIEKQQLTLVYQPQVNIKTGEIIGVEALSRWHNPELGNISPIEFIATAEKIGMIKPLTEWVLLTACKQAVTWKKQGFHNLRMAVNISPSHFLDKEIVPLIARVIDKTGITPADLELEVTENVVQTDKRNLSIFKDLKDLGIKLAIDDFGSGYSSFSSLKHLMVDRLKIDKYFIDDVITDKKALILVSSMIEMGHKLGYEITVEGVESEEQFSILKNLGCQNAQGYLFSRPISSDEITNLLNRTLIS